MIQLFPAKFQVWLATTGLTLALGAGVGAAGVLAWEHQTPFGLARKVESARSERDTARADLRQANADKAALVAETWRWDAAYKRIEKARQDDAAAATRALSARADEQVRQCRAAYQSGVVAGRALGSRSDETNPPPLDPGGPGAGGLRDDLADAWRSGAFRPGSDD